MTYDAAPNAGYLLLFGGSNGHIDQNGVTYGDTWTYRSGVWNDVSRTQCTNATCPESRTYPGMSFYNHSGKQYVVLFGGQYGGLYAGFLRDTWVFQNGAWTNVTPSLLNSTNSPPALYYTSMVWDPVSGFAILYGGCTNPGCNLNSFISDQTWAFEGVTAGQAQWVLLPTSVHPPALYSPGLAFDNATGSVILFGGVTVPTDVLVYTNQTWSYSAATGWVNLTLPRSEQSPTNTPPTRVWTMMAYDPVNSYLVLFGGQQNQSKLANPTLDDTWSYSGGVWTDLTPSLSVSPHARFGGVMAYDEVDSTLVLFGGLSGTLVGSPVLDDVWWFNGTPGAWVGLSGVTSTPSGSSPGLSPYVYVPIAVVAVIVVIGVPIFLLRRKSRSSPPSSVSSSPPGDAPHSEPPPSPPRAP